MRFNWPAQMLEVSFLSFRNRRPVHCFISAYTQNIFVKFIVCGVSNPIKVFAFI